MANVQFQEQVDERIQNLAQDRDYQSFRPAPPPSTGGRSAKKTQRALRDLISRQQMETRTMADGRIEGPLRPCTIVNFNPTPLVVVGQLRASIPRAGASAHHNMNFEYQGRNVSGHYYYIANPMTGQPVPDKLPIYYTTTVAHEPDEQIANLDVPKRDPRCFSPHSIACELLHQYNSPDVKLMGGILCFDQSPRFLARMIDEAEERGSKWEDVLIQVPTRVLLPESAQYIYSLRDAKLGDELARIFETQANYIDVLLQLAHTLWVEDNEVSRKMITDTHRDWARYALKMGYIVELPEWVSAKLQFANEVKFLVKCKYCQAQQRTEGELYCKNGHPFDAFKAFTSGLAVAEMYLEMLPDEELSVVRKIQATKRSVGRGKPDPETPNPGPAAPKAASASSVADALTKAEGGGKGKTIKQPKPEGEAK